AARRRQYRSAGPAAEQIARGCPAHRSAPGFWSSDRLETCLWPGFASPFCALPMAVNSDDRGIDHGILHVWFIRGRLEHPLEDTRFYPIAKALEDGVPVTKRRRQVAPGTAGSSN